MKNTHGGLLLLKSTLLDGFFSHFSNCTNDTKSQKAFHVIGFYSDVKLPIK